MREINRKHLQVLNPCEKVDGCNLQREVNGEVFSSHSAVTTESHAELVPGKSFLPNLVLCVKASHSFMTNLSTERRIQVLSSIYLSQANLLHVKTQNKWTLIFTSQKHPHSRCGSEKPNQV